MNHKSLYRRLEKEGFNPFLQKPGKFSSEWKCFAPDKGLRWISQKGTVICLRCQKFNDPDIVVADYFGGYYANTIKDAIKWIKGE